MNQIDQMLELCMVVALDEDRQIVPDGQLDIFQRLLLGLAVAEEVLQRPLRFSRLACANICK